MPWRRGLPRTRERATATASWGGETKASGLRAAHLRATMVTVASAVVAVGTVAGLVTVGGEGTKDTAKPKGSASPTMMPLPAVPSSSPSPSASASASKKAAPKPKPKPKPKAKAAPATGPTKRSAPVAPSDARLYRHPGSQVLAWVQANPGDPRRPVIQERIADRPAAVWFAQYDPAAITGRVRAVTSGAAAAGRVPVLVAYAIPDRDCGGASQGGAPSLDAYDGWIRNFAVGLGGSEVIVVLEPDAIAHYDCLSAGERSGRYASLALAARTVKAANPKARVYFDAGHSGWHPAGVMAAQLRAAGAAISGDGIFTNVSNFHTTADEADYARRVLAALGGPSHLGAVIDTSRNGNGAPARGQWCDPAGRALGQPPTIRTGQSRIDACLWAKLPGESDGCKGAAGSFTPDYAYDLATG